MRSPEATLACVLVAGAMLAGCSRLSFVKPDTDRADYDQVAPEYNLRDDPHERGRTLAMEQAGAAGEILRAGHPDEAEKQATAALGNDPSSAEAHTILALVAEQRGQVREAGMHYAKAAELAPARGITLNNYATWLCSNGRAADSLALFQRALDDPAYATPAVALANAGSCALKAGQGQLAGRALRAALQDDPQNPVALAGMAQVAYEAGDYLQARAFSERRLAAAPATAAVLQLASQIEQKLGDMAASARYVRRMGTEFPQAQTPRGGESQQ
jgi:type IV pilus assembly protein PilF